MSANEAPAIEVHHLTRRFGELVAVNDVDLVVQSGEVFGLLGPNGAGKTTLIRMLTGILAISSGEAKVAGIDVQREPQRARLAMGVVPQALTSDLELTAWENLDIFARFFEVPRAPRHQRIEELLRKVALWERRDDLVKTFSGGMRRRLEIARGLVHTPKVLFLDEPTIGLDPQSRLVIWDLLRDLRSSGALTISLTTHYMEEAEALCDRVAIVDNGKIVALGSPQQLEASVPGSDTVTLTFERPPDEQTLEALRALPDVRSLELTSEGLRIRADRGAQLLPKLILELEHLGCAVVSASVSRITLEDVFIQLTGRSLREESTRKGPIPSPLQRRFT